MQFSRDLVSCAIMLVLTFIPREAYSQCATLLLTMCTVLCSPLRSGAHIHGHLCLHSPPTNVAVAHTSLRGGVDLSGSNIQAVVLGGENSKAGWRTYCSSAKKQRFCHSTVS